MKIKNGFVLKSIGEHHVVVPVGANTVDFRCMMTLNGSGAFLWRLLEQPQTPQTLTAALLEEYDVSETQAQRDVDVFLTALREKKLLEE